MRVCVCVCADLAGMSCASHSHHDKPMHDTPATRPHMFLNFCEHGQHTPTPGNAQAYTTKNAEGSSAKSETHNAHTMTNLRRPTPQTSMKKTPGTQRKGAIRGSHNAQGSHAVATYTKQTHHNTSTNFGRPPQPTTSRRTRRRNATPMQAPASEPLRRKEDRKCSNNTDAQRPPESERQSTADQASGSMYQGAARKRDNVSNGSWAMRQNRHNNERPRQRRPPTNTTHAPTPTRATRISSFDIWRPSAPAGNRTKRERSTPSQPIPANCGALFF